MKYFLTCLFVTTGLVVAIGQNPRFRPDSNIATSTFEIVDRDTCIVRELNAADLSLVPVADCSAETLSRAAMPVKELPRDCFPADSSRNSAKLDNEYYVCIPKWIKVKFRASHPEKQP